MGCRISGCSLLPEGSMIFSCDNVNTVRFNNKEGVGLYQIGKDKAGACTFDTVYNKYNNSVAVSSGWGVNKCITIMDIKCKNVMTTICMDTEIYGMAVRGKTIY